MALSGTEHAAIAEAGRIEGILGGKRNVVRRFGIGDLVIVFRTRHWCIIFVHNNAPNEEGPYNLLTGVFHGRWKRSASGGS